MSEQPSLHTIFIIDDAEDNRLILEELTQSLGYQAKMAENGRKAQLLLPAITPSVILLDINMPEMNGKEFLEWIKSDSRYKEIPVLMVSAVEETEEIVACLKLGAQDFINKPFEVEILKSRIKRAIERVTAKKQEKELLEKTFVGSVKILSNILTVLSPTIFGKSARIQRFAKLLALELQYEDIWEIELAGLFSLVGTITLSPEIMERFLQGKVLNPEEQAYFDSHPRIGAQLLSNIPRLEGIADIIRHQNDSTTEIDSKMPYGSMILKAAMEFEIIHRKSANPAEFTTHLKAKEIVFRSDIRAAMEKVMQMEYAQDVKPLNVTQIKVGMVFAKDVLTKTDSKIFGQWQEVSDAFLERLHLIHKKIGIREPIAIYIPRKK